MGMNLWEAIKKYFWIVHLIFLTLAAALSANIVSAVLHRRLDPTPQVDLAGLSVEREQSTRSRAHYQPVLDRNIWDSAAVAAEEDDLDDIEQTTLNLKLLGTVDATPPAVSLAIIENNADHQADVYLVGDTIAGAQIIRIGRGEVVLLRNGNEERLTLPDITTASTAAPRRRQASRGGTGSSGIIRHGNNQFEIDRNVVDEALADMSQLMTQARIVPHMTDGQIDGFKIFNIKSNSLFRRIGLRNGDIIHSVNGMGLSGAEHALRAFEALRSENRIQLDITRRGNRQSMTYTIR